MPFVWNNPVTSGEFVGIVSLSSNGHVYALESNGHFWFFDGSNWALNTSLTIYGNTWAGISSYDNTVTFFGGSNNSPTPVVVILDDVSQSFSNIQVPAQFSGFGGYYNVNINGVLFGNQVIVTGEFSAGTQINGIYVLNGFVNWTFVNDTNNIRFYNIALDLTTNKIFAYGLDATYARVIYQSLDASHQTWGLFSNSAGDVRFLYANSGYVFIGQYNTQLPYGNALFFSQDGNVWSSVQNAPNVSFSGISNGIAWASVDSAIVYTLTNPTGNATFTDTDFYNGNSINFGASFTCLITGDGTIYTCGNGTNVGIFKGINQPTPTPFACFNQGSKILSFNKSSLKEEYVPVEDLKKGDLVKTLKDGYLKVEMIGQREMYHPASVDRVKDQLYVCGKEDYPEVFEDLVITGCHSLLVDAFESKEQREKTIEITGDTYVTDKKYRLPACVDDKAKVLESAGTYTIYHVALENEDYYGNYGIYANGLLVETCSKRYLKELSGMALIE
jgi:hypothetical protein